MDKRVNLSFCCLFFSLFLNTSQSGINSAAQANGKRGERIGVMELSLSLFNTCYRKFCSLKSGKELLTPTFD